MKEVDPVDHRLMIDGQKSPDAPEAVTFHVEFERHLFSLVVVA